VCTGNITLTHQQRRYIRLVFVFASTYIHNRNITLGQRWPHVKTISGNNRGYKNTLH